MRFGILATLLFVTQLANAQITWITPDFQITRLSKSRPANPPDIPTDCRAQIAKIVCLVDPPKEKEKPEDRVCLAGGESYAATFESLYDRFPAHMQKMFCHLDHLFIEKSFFATAYAGVLHDEYGKNIAGIMGVRKDFLDSPFTVDHWASWKEQLNFGGNPKSYDLNPNLPMIHSSTQDMLYYVVAHEFGHIFDQSNGLNKYDDCKWDQDGPKGTCLAAPGSWTAIGWKGMREGAREDNDFALRDSLCFYYCGTDFIDPAKAIEVFTGLFSTNFISTYAASNSFDDWAETLAYYTVEKNLNATYSTRLADGTEFDAMAHLHSPLMAQKIKYLEDLFNGPVKYPRDP